MRPTVVMISVSLIVLAVSPLITAIVSGVGTSFNRTGVIVKDGPSPSIEDAKQMLRVYRYSYPTAMLDDRPMYDKAFISNQCRNSTDTGWRFSDDGIEFAEAISITADQLQEYVISEELEKKTTAFSRGFYASCLQTPLLASVCYPYAKELVSSAMRSALPTVLERWKMLYGAAKLISCANIPDTP